jgi:hypothetical protein
MQFAHNGCYKGSIPFGLKIIIFIYKLTQQVMVLARELKIFKVYLYPINLIIKNLVLR